MHLRSLSPVLGEPIELEQAPLLDEAQRRFLRDEGFASYCKWHAGVVELAAEAARRALSDGGRDGISLVVFASQSPGKKDGWQLLQEIGLPRVPIVCLTGEQCGNLGIALRMVDNELAACPDGRVLLVVADAAADAERFDEESRTLLSDAAVAVICTRQAEAAGLEIIARSTVVDAAIDLANIQQAGLTAIQALKSIIRPMLRTVEIDRTQLLMPNYGQDAARFLAQASGFQQPCTPLRAELGHCFAVDPLVTLSRGTHSGVDVDRLFMVITTSSRSWTACCMRWVGPKLHQSE